MHLHEYETTFIFRPDIEEAEHQRLRERFWGLVSDNGGEIMIFEDWGRRRLAYKIDKHEHGHYLFFNYLAPAAVPGEIERVVRIEDNVVRFLTVRNTELANPEEVRVVVRERQRRRLSRAQQSSQAAVDDSRAGGRSRPTPDSMLSPTPISPPQGTAASQQIGGGPIEDDDLDDDFDNDLDDQD